MIKCYFSEEMINDNQTYFIYRSNKTYTYSLINLIFFKIHCRYIGFLSWPLISSGIRKEVTTDFSEYSLVLLMRLRRHENFLLWHPLPALNRAELLLALNVWFPTSFPSIMDQRMNPSSGLLIQAGNHLPVICLCKNLQMGNTFFIMFFGLYFPLKCSYLIPYLSKKMESGGRLKHGARDITFSIQVTLAHIVLEATLKLPSTQVLDSLPGCSSLSFLLVCMFSAILYLPQALTKWDKI